MSYRHIENLYKNQHVLMFKECYALEKVHGTSAHVSFKRGTGPEQVDGIDDSIKYFSGGSSHLLFMEFFNRDDLFRRFQDFGYEDITVFGESYGGKCQGMRETYGEKLHFTAFEVKIGNMWLDVPKAENVCLNLNIEFMPYERIVCTLENIDKERDRPSVIAERRTGQTDKMREGVVLRPLMELSLNNGGRIMAKHKREEFSERKSKKDTRVDPEKQEVLTKTEEIADEWVTPMRLQHVIDSLDQIHDMTATSRVMAAMIEDVVRESENEIVDSKEARRAIGTRTAKMLKKYFQDRLKSINETGHE